MECDPFSRPNSNKRTRSGITRDNSLALEFMERRTMTKIEAAMMEGKTVLVLDEERNRKDEQGSMDNGGGGLVTQKSIEIFINSQE